MELPKIEIPQELLNLPFDVPAMLHPVSAHFAIALPIIILIIELINLTFSKKEKIEAPAPVQEPAPEGEEPPATTQTKSAIKTKKIEVKALNNLSIFLMVMTLVIFIGAFFTGRVDGGEAAPLLSEAGKEELHEHAKLAPYLVIGMGLVFIIKLIALLSKATLMRVLLFLTLIGLTAGVLKQGKDGGELVYEYGANVEALENADDKIFELEEKIEDLEATHSSNVTKLTEEYENKISLLQSKVSELNTSTTEAISQSVDEAVQSVNEAVEAVTQNENVQGITQEVSDAIDSVTQSAKETVEEVSKAVENITEAPAKEENTTNTPTKEESVTPAQEQNSSATFIEVEATN